MKKISEMSRLEFASFVASKLEECGISTVLSGGSYVSIYSADNYVSLALDFIETGMSSRAKVARCIKNLGFSEAPFVNVMYELHNHTGRECPLEKLLLAQLSQQHYHLQ